MGVIRFQSDRYIFCEDDELTVVARWRRAIKRREVQGSCIEINKWSRNIKDDDDGRIAAMFGVSREPPYVCWAFQNLMASTF